MKMMCYCGHDCTRCLTYLATVHNDEALRERSQHFYKNAFGMEIPLEQVHCFGGRSEDVFYLCRECPFIQCCKEHAVEQCADCSIFPCQKIKAYQEKYVNQCNQIDEASENDRKVKE